MLQLKFNFFLFSSFSYSFGSQIVAILQKFYANSANALGLNFINELIVRFRHCSKWVGRQAFAFICQVGMFSLCFWVYIKFGALHQCGQN